MPQFPYDQSRGKAFPADFFLSVITFLYCSCRSSDLEEVSVQNIPRCHRRNSTECCPQKHCGQVSFADSPKEIQRLCRSFYLCSVLLRILYQRIYHPAEAEVEEIISGYKQNRRQCRYDLPVLQLKADPGYDIAEQT